MRKGRRRKQGGRREEGRGKVRRGGRKGRGPRIIINKGFGAQR